MDNVKEVCHSKKQEFGAMICETEDRRPKHPTTQEQTHLL
jgi:hypothetical protein